MTDIVRRLFNKSDKQARESEAASAQVSDAAPMASGLRLIAAYSARGPAGGEPPEREQATSQLDPSASDTGERLETADQASIEVGDQVAVILASAKQAAQGLQDSARQEAERIRAEATEEAATRLTDVKREVARRREEGDKLRAEAVAYGKSTREAADRDAAETRRNAEEESAKRRADVEREAREIRRAAERRSEELTSEALQRQRALVAEAKRSEARLEQLLGVFRTMTSQLEDLLGVERGTASSEDEAPRPVPLGRPPA